MKAPRYRVHRMYPNSSFYHAQVALTRDWLGRPRWQSIDSCGDRLGAEAAIDKFHSELPDTYEYVPKNAKSPGG